MTVVVALLYLVVLVAVRLSGWTVGRGALVVTSLLQIRLSV